MSSHACRNKDVKNRLFLDRVFFLLQKSMFFLRFFKHVVLRFFKHCFLNVFLGKISVSI